MPVKAQKRNIQSGTLTRNCIHKIEKEEQNPTKKINATIPSISQNAQFYKLHNSRILIETRMKCWKKDKTVHEWALHQGCGNMRLDNWTFYSRQHHWVILYYILIFNVPKEKKMENWAESRKLPGFIKYRLKEWETANPIKIQRNQ